MSLQVYSKQQSDRLTYTLELILNQIFGIEYELYSSVEALDLTGAVLNYSREDIPQAFQIIPHSLLFEENIKIQQVAVEENYYFFKTGGNGIGFDILASSFYMVSRYEEYLPSDLDDHGRFRAENSLAYKNNFLTKAVVNRWAQELKVQLLNLSPSLVFKKQSYEYLSTIDIDNAYAYKSKGLHRVWGGLFKGILRLDLDDIKARLAYTFLGKKDPFDVYDTLEQWHQKYQIKSLFFFLIGKNGRYDKNIALSKTSYLDLIKRIGESSEIGIHPSYQSNESKDILEQEYRSLENILGKKLEKNRQHFLKLRLPETYQQLIEVGAKEDYTMGFASQAGFRAGICTAYYWFDLTTNKKTALMVVPFQVMDGTVNDYLQTSPQEALSVIKNILDEVRSVNGLFVTLWHNESLSEMRHWKNWRFVYEDILKMSQE